LIYADAKETAFSIKNRKIEVTTDLLRFLWFISLVLFEYGEKDKALEKKYVVGNHLSQENNT
jgi:hypothetical protein